MTETNLFAMCAGTLGTDEVEKILLGPTSFNLMSVVVVWYGGIVRILVAMANYGTTNNDYAARLIDEYRSMSFSVDIVVMSEAPKNYGEDVKVLVGLPSKNPWSLPFAHKKLFVENAERYDLFIYTEDDTLITQRHIQAFLEATKVLKADEIAGFLRSEQGKDGKISYSTIHSHYHWDPSSVRRRGKDTFAFFSNEHAACYILTRDQLVRAVASGGFNVPPHEGKYDMLVSAATDPYTQCGFTKLICISRLEEFTCQHLTNKYIGHMGLEKSLVQLQVRALLDIGSTGQAVPAGTRVETLVPGMGHNKAFYERRQDCLISMIPDTAKRVLSLGCGWGETEEVLVGKGMQVTAIPLDSVIGVVAETKGIRIIPDSLDSGPILLKDERFDVMLISNLLHLLEDPVGVLSRYGKLIAKNGMAIISVPNGSRLGGRTPKRVGSPKRRLETQYQYTGVHHTSRGVARSWLGAAGFSVVRVESVIGGRWKTWDQLTLGVASGLWAYQFAIAARRQR